MTFTVHEFRWLETKDKAMLEFDNWSRPYEYCFILDKIDSLKLDNPKIHNTCCGTQPIHLQFAKKMNERSGNVIHSDVIKSNFFKELDISIYNITEPYIESQLFDIVVCVSTLEEISKQYRKQTFYNLFNQLKIGGRLLLTCDFPDVELSFCEKLLKTTIANNTGIKLNSMNSYYKVEEFSKFNIIAIDVERTR